MVVISVCCLSCVDTLSSPKARLSDGVKLELPAHTPTLAATWNILVCFATVLSDKNEKKPSSEEKKK